MAVLSLQSSHPSICMPWRSRNTTLSITSKVVCNSKQRLRVPWCLGRISLKEHLAAEPKQQLRMAVKCLYSRITAD
ncbi:UNVERIFIED_CONTAM: hypothetical protein FKN15_013560 [Acipenser sinensis]